jgi:hypothetical protein
LNVDEGVPWSLLDVESAVVEEALVETARIGGSADDVPAVNAGGVPIGVCPLPLARM